MNKLDDATALIIIDAQYGFMPGGGLAVADGDAIVPVINRIAPRFANVVLTQDWHPADHRSFAANHPGAAPFSSVEMPYGPQVLWPVHCVQGSRGADFHPGLDTTRADIVIRKGFRPEIDSYSAFFEHDRTTPTGLAGYLRERGTTEVWLAGLATDFCVGFSALDGIPMATRSGALDPGVILHLMGEMGQSLKQVETMLYRESGLLGVSGFEADSRELMASTRPEAAEAIDLFCLRIAGEVARLAISMGGIDALVFTAGIGEHQPGIRARVAARLAWLGAELDPDANEAGSRRISTAASRVQLLVIPTDEESIIAQEAVSEEAAT